MADHQQSRGRGARHNPPNRFERFYLTPVEGEEPDKVLPRTQFYDDRSQSIISYNQSPDIPFTASVNPYRGCEHGCIYCYARPTHEFLGFSSGLDFESKVMVKPDAPDLLRAELSAPRWRPQVIVFSGVTDCYQPVERRLNLTGQCLEALEDFRNPFAIVTKNALVLRDIELLARMARRKQAAVYISLTTMDDSLRKVMEPRTASPRRRLEVIRRLSQAGVPTGVLLAPVIPGMTDHEIPNLIGKAKEAGAQFAGYVTLRLPHQVKDLFEAWLSDHYPLKKSAILNRIRSIREGKLNQSEFGARMRGSGVFAEQIDQLFKVACRRAGLLGQSPTLSTRGFRRNHRQLDLFENQP